MISGLLLLLGAAVVVAALIAAWPPWDYEPEPEPDDEGRAWASEQLDELAHLGNVVKLSPKGKGEAAE